MVVGGVSCHTTSKLQRRSYPLAPQSDALFATRPVKPVRSSPEEMEEIFSDEMRTRFIGRADRELVAKNYKKLHKLVAQFDLENDSLLSKLGDSLLLSLSKCCCSCLVKGKAGAVAVVLYLIALVIAPILIATKSPLVLSGEAYPFATYLIVAFAMAPPAVILGCSKLLANYATASLGHLLLRSNWIVVHDGETIVRDHPLPTMLHPCDSPVALARAHSGLPHLCCTAHMSSPSLCWPEPDGYLTGPPVFPSVAVELECRQVGGDSHGQHTAHPQKRRRLLRVARPPGRAAPPGSGRVPG